MSPARREECLRAGRAWQIRKGDCLKILTTLGSDSVDAVVCDPPYGIDFQKEDWDGKTIRRVVETKTGLDDFTPAEAFQYWCETWAGECGCILKPGGHLAAFGSPRTAHRLAAGLEDAGLELRDTLMWLYSSGMPKSRRLPGGRSTQLKPAYEPITLARRAPAEPSIAQNIDRHGTGALETEACKVEGRHPANIVLSHSDTCTDEGCAAGCAAGTVDESADLSRAPGSGRVRVSRIFYSPKASRTERNAGCEHLPAQALDLFPGARAEGKTLAAARNVHPTVKPLSLMRWLVRLTSPPGGLILDPFCGSGTTGAAAILEGRRFLGIEREPAYAEIAQARIRHWYRQATATPRTRPAGRHRSARRSRSGVRR